MMTELTPIVIRTSLIVFLCSTRAQNTYRPTVGGLQYINPGTSKSWSEAQQWCTEKNASLSIIDSMDRQNELEQALRNFGLFIYDVWIGGKATYGDPRNWKWLNGDCYDSVVQQQGEYKKSYAYIMSDGTGSIKAYAGVAYTGIYSYICQYSSSASSCTDATSSKRFMFGDTCYVIYDGRLPWFTARNDCLQNGGDLAIIKDVSSSNPPLNISVSTPYWVGLRSSWWTWETGDSQTDVAFTQWEGGYKSQPDGATAQCIAIDGGAFPYWKDWDCAREINFVCQTGKSATTPSPTSTNPTMCIATNPTSSRPTPSSSNSATSPSTSISRSSMSVSPTSADQSLPTPSATYNVTPTMPAYSNVKGTSGDVHLAIGLGVGLGVLFVIAVAAAVAVFLVRRKRNNANGETRTRFTDKTRDSMDMETLDTEILTSNRKTQMINQPQIPAESHYSEVERVTNSGAKVQPVPGPAPVYADLNFDQHDFR